MLNRNQCKPGHDRFMDESLALLHRCEDCLAHLEMIANDPDAIECLQAALNALADKASHASLGNVAEFTRQLRYQLAWQRHEGLCNEALQTLRHCLCLLAWQLELIDPQTGELPMDDHEQRQLLDRLARLAPPGHCPRLTSQ